MSDDFKIELSSDLEYEGMAVYLSFCEQEIAILNYDKGIENIEVKLLPIYTDTKNLSVPLDEFLKVLEKAKQILKKCAEEDKIRDKP
ncbi:MAG: hypothetical protein KDK64_06715 [Chlamydiia bacterium]|nr:hypothetical protein [Chlamydiia bacterium]